MGVCYQYVVPHSKRLAFAEGLEAALCGGLGDFLNLYPSTIRCSGAAQVAAFPFPSVSKSGKRHAFRFAVPWSIIPQPTIIQPKQESYDCDDNDRYKSQHAKLPANLLYTPGR